MKKLLPPIPILGFISPIQPAIAVGCAQVKTMIKSHGTSSNLEDVKGAISMVNAYRTTFENLKSMSSKELTEMNKAAKGLLVECAKPISVYKNLFSIPVFSAFCREFKKIEKYIK